MTNNSLELQLEYQCLEFKYHNKLTNFKEGHHYEMFSVTRRSRSDSGQFLSHLLSVNTDLTDVTLVSDDTY